MDTTGNQNYFFSDLCPLKIEIYFSLALYQVPMLMHGSYLVSLGQTTHKLLMSW